MNFSQTSISVSRLLERFLQNGSLLPKSFLIAARKADDLIQQADEKTPFFRLLPLSQAILELTKVEDGLSEKECWEAIAALLDLPYYGRVEMLEKPLSLGLPQEFLHKHQLLCWQEKNDHSLFARRDPFFSPATSPELYDALYFLLGKRPREVFLPQPLWEEFFAAAQITSPNEEGEHLSLSLSDYLEELLRGAIQRQASDFHFEPTQNDYQLRWRVDGLLEHQATLCKKTAQSLIARLKLLASLDITEQRLPQDGRFAYQEQDRSVDIRLATLPTYHGESLILRLLDPQITQLRLEQLQLPTIILSELRQLLAQPQGLFLVTGPTGTGKTTTLYAALMELVQKNLKIITVEDPVEYEVSGIEQMSVEESLGRSFSTLLPSLLRNDPDVIMIGETRDPSTAQIAIEAALTGHQLLTTLHTGSTFSTITRLLSMGVESLPLATTLEGVLSQRLVRRLCPECSQSYYPPKERYVLLHRLATADQQRLLEKYPPFWGPPQVSALPEVPLKTRCPKCQGSGYQGRLPLFELLRPTPLLRERITQRIPLLQPKESVNRFLIGRTLAQEAIEALLLGKTSWEEVTFYGIISSYAI